MFPRLFSHIAKEYAEKTALFYEGCGLSYGELDRASDRLGAALVSQGIVRGDIVVIRLKRSPAAVIAMLGVLKAGGAICVIDESYPEDRVNFIIQDTKSKTVIDAAWMDALPANIPAADFPQVQREDAAIVVYTSGSTGNPKGVVNTHKALSLAVRGNVHGRGTRDIFLSVASFSFIALVLEIFTPLSLGATIHIAGDKLRKDASALVDYVHQHGITTSFFPPQMARIVLPRLEGQLSTMLVGSDRVVGLHSDKMRILNLYGCSETCGPLSWFEIDRAYSECTPVGVPYEGSRVYILDDENRLLPDGQEGEIC
ncbi:MAG: AMP-binding protein, partial [Oscillospiraceae bacterium]|nr:AMP-binding protein [Oscillospiraceae bacterium]